MILSVLEKDHYKPRTSLTVQAVLHSLRESTQLQVLSVSAHFLNGKRTVCLYRQIVRE